MSTSNKTGSISSDMISICVACVVDIVALQMFVSCCFVMHHDACYRLMIKASLAFKKRSRTDHISPKSFPNIYLLNYCFLNSNKIKFRMVPLSDENNNIDVCWVHKFVLCSFLLGGAYEVL